jgi:hypothetical protein
VILFPNVELVEMITPSGSRILLKFEKNSAAACPENERKADDEAKRFEVQFGVVLPECVRTHGAMDERRADAAVHRF